jgi:Zn-finger nucleic acid-binding protein
MECPRCHQAELKQENYHGIEVDKCPNCKGLWLDNHELDALEDTVLSEDHMKGTMLYAQRDSEISCPKCHNSMIAFNYRAYDLPIDFCSKGQGF